MIKVETIDVTNDESIDNISAFSPPRSQEGRLSNQTLGNQTPIEKFIHDTGYKHQVIYLSCESPILN